MNKLTYILMSVLLAVGSFAATRFVTVDDTQPMPWTTFSGQCEKLPIGSIVQYGSASAPAGWLNCDGSSLSRVTYTNLYMVIGTNYGTGTAANCFSLPNLVSRFPLGATSGLGTTGGVSSVTLTVDQMPSHNHGFAQNSDTGSGNWAVPDSTDQAYLTAHFLTTYTGGGLPHTNMPPNVTVAFIIKYADVVASTATNVVSNPMTVPLDGGGMALTNIGTAQVTALQVMGGTPTNGAVLVATNSAGDGAWSGPAAFCANNSTFGFSNATARTVTFTTEQNDIGNNFNGTVFVVPQNGLYRSVASLFWVRTAGTALRVWVEIMNGETALKSDVSYWIAAYTPVVVDTGYVYLTNGAAISCRIYGESGYTNNVASGGTFSACLIRALP